MIYLRRNSFAVDPSSSFSSHGGMSGVVQRLKEVLKTWNNWLFALEMYLEANSEWANASAVLNKIRLQQDEITDEKFEEIIQQVADEAEEELIVNNDMLLLLAIALPPQINRHYYYYYYYYYYYALEYHR